jgi:hypothetical protein
MRAGAAGLRASGSRCDLRSRAALPPCRPRSVGRGGSAPSAPRSTRDVGQRPPQICESDRHATRGDRPRAPGGASAPSRARPALAGSPHTEDQYWSWQINRDRPHLDGLVFAPEMLVRPQRAPGAGDDGRETIMSDNAVLSGISFSNRPRCPVIPAPSLLLRWTAGHAPHEVRFSRRDTCRVLRSGS